MIPPEIQRLIDKGASQSEINKATDDYHKRTDKKKVDRHGIVHTPPEIVDFILNSVDYVTKKEFGRGLTDQNINILDPFTGNGNFVVRMLSKDGNWIEDKDIERKYKHEIKAHELSKESADIAQARITKAYKDRTGKDEPFTGLSNVDTFFIDPKTGKSNKDKTDESLGRYAS